MALDSTSTYAEIVAAYRDNSDYDTSGSITKVKAFIQAARLRIDSTPQEVGGEVSVREDYRKWQTELERALAWWQENDSDATTAQRDEGVVYLGTGNDFRGY